MQGRTAAEWRADAHAMAERWQFVDARRCIENALTLEPENDDDISLLGWLLNELGEPQQALAVLDPQRSVRPVSLGRRLRYALLLPRCYHSATDVRAWRERYARELETLGSGDTAASLDARAVAYLSQTNFLLAYQGGNDRPLQERYAAFIARLLARAYPDLVQARPMRVRTQADAGERIRVAFVTSFLHTCTIGHYFRSWMEDLPTDEFEVVVVYTGNTPDALTDEVASRTARFVRANGDALKVAQAVLDSAPDIVVYPEVGMHSETYLLANMRLAPIQCAAWGHPVTTGSRSIDVFFSCEAMESPDAASHYSERLVGLPGIGTRYRRPPPALPRARTDWRLPTEGHMYLCPQSLFKVHPDNDELLLDILAADPDGFVVFFQDASRANTLALADRLMAGMAQRGMPQRRQIKFLPQMPADMFRAVAASADVVLDTLHWSGGNTSLDVLSTGTPLVTLPGAMMRGRQSAAMLRMLGVPELIAKDRADYTQLATAIAADAKRRAALRQRILAGLAALFDQPEPTQALADHLRRLYRERQVPAR